MVSQGDQGANSVARYVRVNEKVQLRAPVSVESDDAAAAARVVLEVRWDGSRRHCRSVYSEMITKTQFKNNDAVYTNANKNKQGSVVITKKLVWEKKQFLREMFTKCWKTLLGKCCYTEHEFLNIMPHSSERIDSWIC